MAEPHWALYEIIQNITRTGYEIVVLTFHPCHLWMRWTKIEPEEHLIPRTIRGLAIKGDKRFCFVVFRDNEQAEAGDTYTHTFLKEPWPHCETRWFYFHGTIAGVASPSTSAIFKKHRIAPELWLLFFEDWSPLPDSGPDYVLLFPEEWSSLPDSGPDFTRLLFEEWTS